MYGMRVSNIGTEGAPLVVTPIPQWGARQVKSGESGSSFGALLPFPVIPGNLIIGLGFYRRGIVAGLPPVAWAELSGNPWTLLAQRKTLEGNSQFERGIFLYGMVATEPNDRNIRFSTGVDCVDVPPDEIGTQCDVLRALIVELVPPAGSSYEDPAFIVNNPTDGDNGATTNGLSVGSAAPWSIVSPIGDTYLIVAATGWRIQGGNPMAGLSWSPQFNSGGIVAFEGLHGVSVNFGVHPGDETFTPTATFAEGSNSGLSMAAVAFDVTL